MKVTEQITSDMRMEFGIGKCRILHIEKGRWKEETNVEMLDGETVGNLTRDETYKYLGFQQNTRLDHTVIKKHLREEYQHRLRLLLRTNLNSKNLFKAINTFAVPILTYSFGIIKWTETDLEGVNILTRTELTKSRKSHPKSSKQRITLNRKDGGRGMIDIHQLHFRQIKSLRQYFHSKDTDLHRAIVKADRNYTPLNLKADNISIEEQTTQQKKEEWAQKKLHGKHCYNMANEQISREHSYTWLVKGQLYPETEGFTIAIQDQVIPTRNYRKYIIKDTDVVDDRCRRCHVQGETIEHIIGACKLLAGTEYTERHNSVAKIIHQAMAARYRLQENNTPYYKYTPTSIIENDSYKLYWDITIHTDKTIAHNRPDITFQDKQQNITYIIDIAVPLDTNIISKYDEKLEKYKPLALEIERVWKQKRVHIVPFIISVTGITPYSFIEHLKQLQLELSVHQHAQKSVILKTCNITRSFLHNT